MLGGIERAGGGWRRVIVPRGRMLFRGQKLRRGRIVRRRHGAHQIGRIDRLIARLRRRLLRLLLWIQQEGGVEFGGDAAVVGGVESEIKIALARIKEVREILFPLGGGLLLKLIDETCLERVRVLLLVLGKGLLLRRRGSMRGLRRGQVGVGITVSLGGARAGEGGLVGDGRIGGSGGGGEVLLILCMMGDGAAETAVMNARGGQPCALILGIHRESTQASCTMLCPRNRYNK